MNILIRSKGIEPPPPKKNKIIAAINSEPQYKVCPKECRKVYIMLIGIALNTV